MERKLSGRSQVRALAKEGQLEKAIEMFEGMVSGGECGPYDHVYLGDLFMQAGRSDSAISRYEDAIAAYTHLGFHRNALALCRKILRLDPQHLAAYRQMGDLCAAEELYGDALYAYFAYLERAPEEERTAEIYRQALRRAEELAPRRAEFAIRLSDLLVQLQRPDSAATVLREALQQAARAGAVEVTAGLRERLAHVAPSLAAMAMPDAEPPYEPVETESEAFSEAAGGEYILPAESGEAMEALAGVAPPEPTPLPLTPALDEAPQGHPVRYGEIDLGQESARAAEAELEASATAADPGEEVEIEIEPFAGPVLVEGEESDAWGSASEESEAREEPVEEEAFATHYARGLEQMEQGELEAALESFAAAAWDEALDASQARLLQEAQARCLAGLGRHREAVREFLLALQRPHPGAETAELIYLLALEYEALGDLDEARKRLREALALRPDYAEAEARLADLAEGAA